MKGIILALLIGLALGVAIAVPLTALASGSSEQYTGTSHQHMDETSEEMMELCSQHMKDHEGRHDMMGMMSMMSTPDRMDHHMGH